MTSMTSILDTRLTAEKRTTDIKQEIKYKLR
jgi:hypothetical protein